MRFVDTDEGFFPVDRIERIITKGSHGDIEVKISVEGKWHTAILNERQLGMLTSTLIVPAERHSAVVYRAPIADYPESVEVVPLVALAINHYGIMDPGWHRRRRWLPELAIRPSWHSAPRREDRVQRRRDL